MLLFKFLKYKNNDLQILLIALLSLLITDEIKEFITSPLISIISLICLS